MIRTRSVRVCANKRDKIESSLSLSERAAHKHEQNTDYSYTDYHTTMNQQPEQQQLQQAQKPGMSDFNIKLDEMHGL